MSAYGGMSNNDTHIASEISSVDELDVLDDNKNVVDCIESGQIIFKLAEEIRSLRYLQNADPLIIISELFVRKIKLLRTFPFDVYN